MIPREAHVLVVDDSQTNCTLLQSLLQALGVSSVTIARDGIEGLEAIDQRRPDLVLLDVMMPRMDGYEMCRRLRERYPRTELPVIFVTALDSHAERAACFAAGGTDMIAKPINSPEIAARVGVHLENRALLAELRAYRERLSDELAAARSAQAELQPSAEQLAYLRRRTGLEVHGLMESSSELGGDFWTVFDAGPDRLGLLVADFSGHGVAAALNVFRLHAIMHRLPDGIRQPAALLSFLNGELVELLKPGQFAAVLAAVIDQRAGTLTYAGGLTPQPILVAGGRPRLLEVLGPPLGAFADAEYDETCVTMPPGAGLLAYSDALLETMVDGRPVADMETLLEWAADEPPGSCLAAAMLARFHQRLPGDPPDDLTLVCVRRPSGVDG